MIFNDRFDAGGQLADELVGDDYIRKHISRTIVLSLVRGGAPIGHEISKRLGCFNRPLIVKKIGAPGQEELAIGAICGSQIYLDDNLISYRLGLSKQDVENQVNKSRQKENEYWQKFKKRKYWLKNRIAIVADDGIATGASVIAAAMFLAEKQVTKMYLAVPVVPGDFPDDHVRKLYDKFFILHKDPHFNAVSQYYRHFDQVSDKETMKYF
ncbi:hypothetical protein A3J15_02720 [Candidatus Roizmanbacteria bacterium RIFCSPLOWO2_02_FULL_38_10]|uniref:Uncharacterized protein n=1 Tax=Candidatus Roizmanbacteria bacterium RIFCSPLOWO2_02_FULL_38_10 TaxID=1802074 RepID=A0A1F7JJZ6_9BACT|nr:MAG: hypothetical protein A3J15_02720 [Candidatus Roizmanbacteria bacterium RIFCSPLOWO2_02_FULL_38_10]